MVNPYAAPTDHSDATSADDSTNASVPYRRAALIGAACGGLLPFALAFYEVYQHRLYVASLPPNQAVCGTGLAMVFGSLVFFVAPCMAFVGGGVGCLIAYCSSR